MNKLSDDLMMITSKLMLIKDKNEILSLTSELNDLISRLLETEKRVEINSNTGKSVTGFLKFTDQEISKMPKSFRKEFRAEGCTAHVIKRPSGKKSHFYEIRYRRNGYNISVSSVSLATAKEKFIQAIKDSNQQNHNLTTKEKVPQKFNEFLEYYFENFRKRKVTELTYKFDCQRYKKYIQPHFKGMLLKSITPKDCQTLLDSIKEQGHGKTADEIYSLMNVTFKSAIAHGIIERNPLNIVLHVQHERTSGKALSIEEEKILINAVSNTNYFLAVVVALYTGLRPNELPTAKIENGFIVAVNSKRKNRKVEYKKIPISPMLAPYLEGIKELKFPSYNRLRLKVSEILPTHKLYDLRTTFYTRCRTCGIADAALNEFMGHSEGKLRDAYTDLPDDYLLQEGNKIKY